MLLMIYTSMQVLAVADQIGQQLRVEAIRSDKSCELKKYDVADQIGQELRAEELRCINKEQFREEEDQLRSVDQAQERSAQATRSS
ncbi:hypothetical protein F511_30786 [Dorcoceras hygrometricum]|uniref:Uncharacterized protein n=1 Tax=Dorcoceras hygrometricum TaxID=472368 RepID=A0A2Z7A8X3_9LAMI|nr:hypothetical protein F511_30786 [Dorcoceras hygrometricum]